MASIEQTVETICAAPTIDARIAAIRTIAGRHGSDDHPAIYARLAQDLYVPHLAPNFAFINVDPFYSQGQFDAAYRAASVATSGFTKCDEATLTEMLSNEPHTLLAMRTICGLTKGEFAVSTSLASSDGSQVSDAAVDGMERHNKRARSEKLHGARANLLARTIIGIMDGTLFGDGQPDVPTKQAFKPDTTHGWESVAQFATEGVPYSTFLHQRHYGGAFRQLLDATSTSRGDLLEQAVEDLFITHRIPYIRTGAHNQADIYKTFSLDVKPAPDFVVYDCVSGSLRGMLECKTINDGGTARDKALRFMKLRAESTRLNGTALAAVLGGLGWRRVNDALGPVVEATEGRVFTLSTLEDMLTSAPFSDLVGTAPASALAGS